MTSRRAFLGACALAPVAAVAAPIIGNDSKLDTFVRRMGSYFDGSEGYAEFNGRTFAGDRSGNIWALADPDEEPYYGPSIVDMLRRSQA